MSRKHGLLAVPADDASIDRLLKRLDGGGIRLLHGRDAGNQPAMGGDLHHPSGTKAKPPTSIPCRGLELEDQLGPTAWARLQTWGSRDAEALETQADLRKLVGGPGQSER